MGCEITVLEYKDLRSAGFSDMIRAQADERGHGWVKVPESVLAPAGLIAEGCRPR